MSMIDKNWTAIGTLHDIPQQGARLVKYGATTIAVFRSSQNEVFALEDKAPVKDGPLSQGIVHGKSVTCPISNWVISLETGEALGADKGQTKTYPVKLEGDSILIAL